MNNPDYTVYKERRDHLVRKFCDLSKRLEDYNIEKLPTGAVDEIFAIIVRQTDGHLHEYPQNIEGIKRANVGLARDIERLEYVYQKINLWREK